MSRVKEASEGDNVKKITFRTVSGRAAGKALSDILTPQLVVRGIDHFEKSEIGRKLKEDLTAYNLLVLGGKGEIVPYSFEADAALGYRLVWDTPTRERVSVREKGMGETIFPYHLAVIFTRNHPAGSEPHLRVSGDLSGKYDYAGSFIGEVRETGDDGLLDLGKLRTLLEEQRPRVETSLAA